MTDINLGDYSETDLLSNEDSLAFALRMLLSTRPGERIYRDYGTDYRQYLHQLASRQTEAEIRMEGLSSVGRHEPLMDTVTVRTSVELQSDGRTYLVTVTVKDRNDQSNESTFYGQLVKQNVTGETF
jgi:phage baseplate assembly protein W